MVLNLARVPNTQTCAGTGRAGIPPVGVGVGVGRKACAITSPVGDCYAEVGSAPAAPYGMSTYGKGGAYLTRERDAAGRRSRSDGVPG